MTLAAGYNMYQLSKYKCMTNLQRLVVLEIYILVLCDWTDGTDIWTTPGGNISVYQQRVPTLTPNPRQWVPWYTQTLFPREANKVQVDSAVPLPHQRHQTRNIYLQRSPDYGDRQYWLKFTHAFVMQVHSSSHHHPKPPAPFTDQSKNLHQSTPQ